VDHFPTLATVYGLMLLAVLLLLALTPDAVRLANGIRRAREVGSGPLGPWDDAAPAGPLRLALAGLTFAFGVAAGAAPAGGAISTAQLLLPPLIGASAVVYAGSALQLVRLRLGRRGLAPFLLLLAGLWAVPLFLVGLLSVRGSLVSEAARQGAGAVSPLLGVGLAASLGQNDVGATPAAVSLTVNLGLCALFWALAARAERQARTRAADA
jgi:hypothetical protein